MTELPSTLSAALIVLYGADRHLCRDPNPAKYLVVTNMRQGVDEAFLAREGPTTGSTQAAWADVL
jgi:hypothetical protein